MGHNDLPGIDLTPSKQERFISPPWATTVGHKRWPRGLSLRGSIFQFRVRVPADLRGVMGCSHVKRSLGTDSPSLAVRLRRKMAAEIDAMFEEQRRVAGLRYEEGLLVSNDNIGFVVRPGGSWRAEVRPAAPSLSTIYQRYLDDPTRRRCARTDLPPAEWPRDYDSLDRE
ncbi:DUF6538 domain-containing protein, partial [Sphingobium yanoikuyae]|uniref:DUF6538 domain-containing protein n=1 Tax=Sphingobium yanoikuyae TaxID=13690 RepID=UPI0039180912